MAKLLMTLPKFLILFFALCSCGLFCSWRFANSQNENTLSMCEVVSHNHRHRLIGQILKEFLFFHLDFIFGTKRGQS